MTRYIDNDSDSVSVEVKKLIEERGDANEEEALMRSLLEQFERYITVSQKMTKETLESVSDIDEPGRFADMITSHLSLKLKNKQRLLETLSVPNIRKHLIKACPNKKKC